MISGNNMSEIEQIKEFLETYKSEVSYGGHPLMSQLIYIEHVQILLSSLESKDKEIEGLKEQLAACQRELDRARGGGAK